MKNILVVDSDKDSLNKLSDYLTQKNLTLFKAHNSVEALNILNQTPIDCLFLDLWLPVVGGIELLGQIKEQFSNIPIAAMSNQLKPSLIVKTIHKGADTFLLKPFDLKEIDCFIDQLFSRDDKISQSKKETLTNEMIGQSMAIKNVKRLIHNCADTSARVMILGENGTGKELVARAIHNQSSRRNKPFIHVNCAAIPESLIESELFGHEKGAFTGAIGIKKGKFELAHGGTLFLDEIADMSLATQAKVLRAIQELVIDRIGSDKPIDVDVRIICATNKSLKEEIEKKRFREDLFYRLNVIEIQVAPLRERVEDIPLLVESFLKDFTEKNRQSKILSRESLDLISGYHWPGNIRELKNFIERVVILSEEDSISADFIKPFLQEKQFDKQVPTWSIFEGLSLGEAKELFERTYIAEHLIENKYNISQTAKKLGIYPSNLHNKIKRYDLEVKK